MRVPIDWLNEYVAVAPDEADALADLLTMAGLEVEETLATDSGPVWFTKITPNRGDWASVYGTARELAACLPGRPLAPLPDGDTPHGDPGVTVRIDDPNCHRFRATVLDGVAIGPTPEWIQKRLAAALGDRYRMINNVADITNYVMLELGQPLHAFDLDTIPGGEIVVRASRPGERLVTLDGAEHALPEGTLCICDRERPVSIAGIMGGRDTEITDATTRVLLETAHFDPFHIRRTAKKVVRSEASYRFERYVDPNLVAIAAARAAQLIVAHCGGRVVGVVETVAQPAPRRRVLARMERIRRLLGADVDRDAAIGALERLGVGVERSAGAMDCLIPTWRPDLTIEDDIAEEVGRIALGYAQIPEKIDWQLGARGQDSPRGRFHRKVKPALAAQGLQEVLSHSLVAPGPLTDPGGDALTLRNPMAPEYSQLRTSLLPNLIAIAGRAHRDGIRDIGVFEVGPVYAERDGAVVEPQRIAGLVAGSGIPNAWAIRAETFPADFYLAKGVVEELLQALGIDADFAPTTHPLTHPYRTAEVRVGDRPVGIVGELSSTVAEENDLPRRACVFDLDGDALEALAGDARTGFAKAPEFPAVTRDLAPVFGPDATWAQVEAAARAAAGPLLESLRLTDLYAGANLGEGRRALTLRLVFRAERTLTGDEVDAALDGVRAALTAIGGEFRG